MKIVVASGKGGTGKTTVALNLALAAEGAVRLLDCDVEEPNLHLFLNAKARGRQAVHLPVPKIDEKRCDACGSCAAFCRFNAIVSFGETPMVFPELCHGCGGCMRVCPQKAIREVDHRIGAIERYDAGAIELIQGRIEVGSALAPPVIEAVKREAGAGLCIIDAPPGTACPAVAAVKGADFALLVTEPTPFGLHDLRLAVQMARALKIPLAVAVNRAIDGADCVHEYCRAEDIPILAEIPDDRRIAETYARGARLIEALPEYRDRFARLLRTLLAKGGAA